MTKFFTSKYWRKAVSNFKSIKYLCIAALVIALRVLVKGISIPIAVGLEITFDCYINAIGSIIYGPIVGLFVGAISDTIGAILFPSGLYFFPFIFTEMLSSFIFGLCLWDTDLTTSKIFKARFLVSFICNICLTSILMKWYYQVFAIEGTYNLINLVRIAKNLILFPLESILLTIFISTVLPVIKQVIIINSTDLQLHKKEYIKLIIYFIVAVALIIVYILWLKPFLVIHNIKIF